MGVPLIVLFGSSLPSSTKSKAKKIRACSTLCIAEAYKQVLSHTVEIPQNSANRHENSCAC